MSEQFAEITILKDKILDLISMYESQKEANNILKEENRNLIKETQLKEYEISELKQQYETLKIAKTLTSSSKDAHDAKIKINRIVREIDSCIGLLNK